MPELVANSAGGGGFPAQPLLRFCLLHPCCVLALALALARLWEGPPPRPQGILDLHRPVEVRGWVSAPPQELEAGLRFEVTPLEVRQGERLLPYPGRFSILIYGEQTDLQPPLRYGEEVRLNALPARPSSYALPGVADFAQLQWRRGILHRIRLKSSLQLQRLPGRHGNPLLRSLFEYRRRYLDSLRGSLPEGPRKLLLSLFLAVRRELAEEDQEWARRLGILHLFVVSGLHLSVLLLLLHRLLGRWGTWGVLLNVVGMWAYVLLLIPGWPTLRAAWMMSLLYLLTAFGLPGRLMQNLGLTTLLLLAWDPASLFSAGFQFSVLSLCAIGLFFLPLQPYLSAFGEAGAQLFSASWTVDQDPVSRWSRRVRFRLELMLEPRRTPFLLGSLRFLLRVLAWAGALLATGVFIQLWTCPLALYYGNLWPWTQVVHTLLLLPLLYLILPLALLHLALFWLPGAEGILWVLGLLLGCFQRVVDRSTVLATFAYLPTPPLWSIPAYLLGLLMLWYGLRGRRRILCLGLPLLLLIPLERCAVPADGRLQITMLDVGQGESLHLRYPDNRHALLDTGGSPFPGVGRQFVGRQLVARYLWQERVTELEYVLLSHPHADHIQGLEFLREAFPIRRLHFHHQDPLYEGLPLVPLQAGRNFILAGVYHQVLHPPSSPAGAFSTNDASLVLRLTHGRFSLLLTGDIEASVEGRLLPSLRPVSVLKAAHHGARNSSSRDFLLQVCPRLVIISAGRSNPFGHPSPQTLERLQKLRIPYLITWKHGSIRILSDGLNWEVQTYSLSRGDFQPVSLPPYEPLCRRETGN